MPPKTESPELQAQTHLVRTVAATLEIKAPKESEVQFRTRLLRKATTEIKTVKAAFLIRLYEAACAVDFADADVAEFRVVCQAALSTHLKLSEHSNPPRP